MQDTQKICGVYFLYYRKRLTYIGRSRDIDARIERHLILSKYKFDCLSYVILEPDELVAKEREFIKLYAPAKNLLHTPKMKKIVKRSREMIEFLAHKRLRETPKNP